MPMFDDPREQLRRMQEELLAAEEEEEELYEDDLDDLDELLEEYLEEADYEEFYEEADDDMPAYRNYSNNYGRSHAARFVDTEDYEEELDDDAVYYREDYRAGKKKAKKESNRGLLIIICLELIGIAAVLGWWALWLL